MYWLIWLGDGQPPALSSFAERIQLLDAVKKLDLSEGTVLVFFGEQLPVGGKLPWLYMREADGIYPLFDIPGPDVPTASQESDDEYAALTP
jgi:hypothetical protein